MLSGIFSTLLVPETSRRTLEDISNESQDNFIQGIAAPAALPNGQAAPAALQDGQAAPAALQDGQAVPVGLQDGQAAPVGLQNDQAQPQQVEARAPA